MGRPSVRGNVPLLFLLFFGLATLLAGFAYEASQAYASTGALPFGLVAFATGAGFVFSLIVVARILYKVAARASL